MRKNEFKKGEIAIYKTPQNEVELKVKLEKETVWLTLDQMAILFSRDKSVISRHIKNIFAEKELLQKSVVVKIATTATDGKTYQVDYYSLDVVISVGYRVKSQNGVKFRIWASKILKQYLIKGYAINEKRLLEAKSKFYELQKIVSFLFVYFLDKADYLFKSSGERKINNNALVALALLVAESDPKEKETMIKIIKNILLNLQ